MISDRFSNLLLHRHFVVCCLAAHVLVRVAVIILVPVSMTSDAAWYLNRGISIASGNGYSEDGLSTAYWPVGYPAFVGAVFWLVGPYVIAAQMANVVVSAGTALLTLALARIMLRDEAGARVAMVLVTIYPNNIAYANLTVSEPLFTLQLMAATYLYIRSRGWAGVALAGIVFGIAALTRPQMLFFPVMLVSLRLVFEPAAARIRSAPLGLVLYLGIVVVLAPWSVRNVGVFHEAVFISTNGGANLLIGNNPKARGNYQEPDAAAAAQVHFSVADQVAADKRARSLAIEWIRENPASFVALIPRKAWWLWAPDGEAEWSYQAGYARYEERAVIFRLVRVINQVFYVAVLIAAAASAVIAKIRGVPSPWLLVVYVLAVYMTLVCAVFFGYSRYHFPLIPWVAIAAGWSSVMLLRRRLWRGEGGARPRTAVA